MNEEQPRPLKLSGQQRALYEALSEKDQTLAGMYLGALMVLGYTDNPDRLAQASHSLRELMEKIPVFVDVQMKAHAESLKSKVNELEGHWLDTLKKTKCRNEETWEGNIDRPLSKLLEQLQTFFDWFAKHHPRRRAEVTETLRGLDASGRNLPGSLEELNVQAWMKTRDFLVYVAHHRNLTTQREFVQWLDALERFLLDRLRPRTFADIDTIDEIIREGESDA